MPFMYCDPPAVVTKYVAAEPVPQGGESSQGMLRLSTGTVMTFYRFPDSTNPLAPNFSQLAQNAFFEKFRTTDHIQVCFGPPLRDKTSRHRDALVGDLENSYSFSADAIPGETKE